MTSSSSSTTAHSPSGSLLGPRSSVCPTSGGSARTLSDPSGVSDYSLQFPVKVFNFQGKPHLPVPVSLDDGGDPDPPRHREARGDRSGYRHDPHRPARLLLPRQVVRYQGVKTEAGVTFYHLEGRRNQNG